MLYLPFAYTIGGCKMTDEWVQVRLRTKTHAALAALVESTDRAVQYHRTPQFWDGDRLSFDAMIAELIRRALHHREKGRPTRRGRKTKAPKGQAFAPKTV